MKTNNIKRKKYKKTNVYPFLSRMYKLFKTNPESFILKKLKNQGEYDLTEETITIDYRKEIMATLIHETLHCFHPEWNEHQVIREERKIINSISICQVKNILKQFSLLF